MSKSNYEVVHDAGVWYRVMSYLSEDEAKSGIPNNAKKSHPSDYRMNLMNELKGLDQMQIFPSRKAGTASKVNVLEDIIAVLERINPKWIGLSEATRINEFWEKVCESVEHALAEKESLSNVAMNSDFSMSLNEIRDELYNIEKVNAIRNKRETLDYNDPIICELLYAIGHVKKQSDLSDISNSMKLSLEKMLASRKLTNVGILPEEGQRKVKKCANVIKKRTYEFRNYGKKSSRYDLRVCRKIEKIFLDFSLAYPKASSPKFTHFPSYDFANESVKEAWVCLRANLSQIFRLELSVEDSHFLNETITSYLPRIFEAYDVFNVSGLSVDDKAFSGIVSQFEIISIRIDSMRTKYVETAKIELAAQSELLEKIITLDYSS